MQMAAVIRTVIEYASTIPVRHQHTLFLEKPFDSLEMTRDQTDAHKTIRAPEMRKSEQDVRRLEGNRKLYKPVSTGRI